LLVDGAKIKSPFKKRMPESSGGINKAESSDSGMECDSKPTAPASGKQSIQLYSTASFSSVNWGEIHYQNSYSISFVFGKNYLNFD
jgi:hypothetical protein